MGSLFKSGYSNRMFQKDSLLQTQSGLHWTPLGLPRQLWTVHQPRYLHLGVLHLTEEIFPHPVPMNWQAPGMLQADPFLRADPCVKRRQIGCCGAVPKMDGFRALVLNSPKSCQIGSLFLGSARAGMHFSQ